jgi:hypothetical protein
MEIHNGKANRVVTLFLLSTLISSTCLGGGQGAATTGQAAPTKLKIVVVQGEGAVNNVKQRVAREMIVEVQDENDRPLAGVAVAFMLPNSGAGGTFANGSKLLTVRTDLNGRAITQAFQPNNVVGNFKIDVSASYQGQTATTTISGTNAIAAGAATGGGISATTIGIIAGVAGAAAAGVVAAKRSSTNTTRTPQGTIGVGSGPVLGVPRPD